MKLQLEFEKEDFQEMIIEYFKQRGFEVNNIEEITDAFVKVFETGLKIDASIVATPPPKTKKAAVTPAVEEEKTPLRVVDTSPSVVKGNPSLSLTDLRDPTGPRTAPSRDELLKQNERELQHILKQSTELEEQGPNV